MTEYTTKTIKELNKLGFRDTFGREIVKIGKKYPNTVVLAADLSDAARFAGFKKRFPDRYIQVGVAEQNMVSIASGLALNGKMCFCASFTPFVSLRCCEQVRNDVCYQNCNVKIVGLDGGLASGYLGVTHYGLEDIAIMRSISNIIIISPCDCLSLAKLLWKITDHDGPVYIRLSGGKNVPVIYDKDREFKIGKSIALTEGDDVSIFATGLMVSRALEASNILGSKGISVRLIDVHSIKPIDIEAVQSAIKETGLVVTIEEHKFIGGLGSAVAEVMSEQENTARLLRIGLPDRFIHRFNSHDQMLVGFGLTGENIAKNITKNL